MLTRITFVLLTLLIPSLVALHAQNTAASTEASANTQDNAPATTPINDPAKQPATPTEATKSGPASNAPKVSVQDAKLNKLLNRYTGRWVGVIEIRSLSKVLQKIEIEQLYWWEMIDGVHTLRGQAVMASLDSVASSKSLTYIENGRIYTIATQDNNQHFYVAKISQDGNSINWLPADDTNPLSRKLTESFVEKPEGEFLIIDSFEEVSVGDKSVVLTMRGELKRESDQIDSDKIPQTDETPDETTF